MNYTADQLWHMAWPEVPWLCASPEDVRLFMHHANSLADYNEWRATR